MSSKNLVSQLITICFETKNVENIIIGFHFPSII